MALGHWCPMPILPSYCIDVSTKNSRGLPRISLIWTQFAAESSQCQWYLCRYRTRYANSTIKLYRHWVPSITEYPTLILSFFLQWKKSATLDRMHLLRYFLKSFLPLLTYWDATKELFQQNWFHAENAIHYVHYYIVMQKKDFWYQASSRGLVVKAEDMTERSWV